MSSSISIAITVVAFLCFTYADFLEDQRYPEKNRLPLNIKPINYNISIIPYLNETHPRKFTFDGECSIEIQAAQDTNGIQLHMKNLDVELAEYYRKNTSQRTVLPSGIYNNLTDIQSYILNETLQANVSYILNFKYVGHINEENIGFYRRSYTIEENKTEFFAATNFERSHARRVFPCFDEPNFKATFDLSLTSNEPSLYMFGPSDHYDSIAETYTNTIIYETTPKMSTFSLGFLFASFDRFHRNGTFEVLVRYEYYYNRAEYTFDYGKATLRVLGDYLGTPDNSIINENLDLAYIPGFPTTTSESWGLITIPELLFLNDNEYTATQNTVRGIAYAESLMWFGNLVTPEKWNFSWLKDGFGTYFGYFGGHMVNSSLRLDQQFVIDIQQNVMRSDFTMRINPMIAENVSTLDNLYDKYSAHKGASFIRMTKHILGEQNFRTSLNEYLETHKYKNTVPSDLFTIWKKYWPEQYIQYADSFFNSFTTQVGLPVVTFRRKFSYVEVSQKRFVSRDFDVGDQNLSYTIPITFTTSEENDYTNTSVRFFLEKSPIKIEISNRNIYIIGNIQAAGYYRVNYDDDQWYDIAYTLRRPNWSGIHELNRAQIVDDLFHFALTGENHVYGAMIVLNYMLFETNYLPWTPAFNFFKFLVARDDTDDLTDFVKQLMEPMYNKLGFEERREDTPLDILNRPKFLKWSCKVGNTDCISKAKSYFNKNLTENPVPINIRSVVYCVAMRDGNVEDFEKLYNIYQTETNESERKMILLSFGCVKDKKLISRVFDMILSAEIDLVDKSDAIESLFSNNKENVDSVFVLIEQNFEKVLNSVNIENVMYGLAYYLKTEAQQSRLHALNNIYKNDFRNFNRAVTRCEVLVTWTKLYVPVLS